MDMRNGNRVRDRLAGKLLAIHRQHAGATLAGAGAVVFEVEHDRVLARLERTAQPVFGSHAALPAVALQIEEVVNEDRLAFEQVETVAAEAAAHSRDHSLRAALRDRHLGGDGVVLVQNAGSIADGNVGILTRVGELRSPGGRARSRRN